MRPGHGCPPPPGGHPRLAIETGVPMTGSLAIANRGDGDAGSSGCQRTADPIKVAMSRTARWEVAAGKRGSRDAALVITIPARTGYTVVVSNKEGADGVILAEVYELP